MWSIFRVEWEHLKRHTHSLSTEELVTQRSGNLSAHISMKLSSGKFDAASARLVSGKWGVEPQDAGDCASSYELISYFDSVGFQMMMIRWEDMEKWRSNWQMIPSIQICVNMDGIKAIRRNPLDPLVNSLESSNKCY